MGRGDGWHFRLIRCCFCYVAVALSFSLLCRGSKGQGENERAQNLFGTQCYGGGNPIDWFSSHLENWCLKVFVICFISQLMKRSKHGLYVFPPKKTLIRRRHCAISQSYCSMTSKRKYRLISRKFSGMSCPFEKPIKSLYFGLFLFLFCSHVFISRPYENRSNASLKRCRGDRAF